MAKKIFHLLWLGENCVEKNKKNFSNQSGDFMPTSMCFANYRSLGCKKEF